MFYIDNGVTNLITETTEIPLEVTDQFARTGTNTFYVSCPSIGTGTISATLTLDGGTTLSDTVSFKCIEPLRRLVSMTQVNATGPFYNPSRLVVGTEVYFTGTLLNTRMIAFCQRFGIVVSKAAKRFALAHELGHALGLLDIYYVVLKDGNGIERPIGMKERDDVVRSGHFYAGSRDWGDETGRGFYGKNDTLARIIDRLLMYGHEHEWTGDIPDWRVFGLSKTPKKGHRKVGASEIEENDRKVFTR